MITVDARVARRDIRRMDRPHYVYILASARNGTLYVGATNDLARRIWQHRQDVIGFTARYGVHRLVHVETFDDMTEALLREKRLKRWRRAWKLALIEEGNPMWKDLSDRIG